MSIERYTKDHECIRIDGDVGTVGISVHAAGLLGDIVFIEVPAVGRKVKAGEPAAVIESVKAASDVYAPLTGEVVESNGDLAADPSQLSQSTADSTWLFKIKLTNEAEVASLMDAAAYEAFIKENS